MAAEKSPCPADRPPKTTSRPPGRHEGLSTLQINALAQFLETRNFTAHDIARYSYETIARLPKIGRKGIVRIEAWLAGYNLSLVRFEQRENNRESMSAQGSRLAKAARLLRENGYGVFPPSDDPDIPHSY